jgi:NADPH-dependent curcumin reductase CurA
VRSLEGDAQAEGTAVADLPGHRLHGGVGASWLAEGTLRSAETAFEGLDSAPAALLGVLRGADTGKMLVRLDAPPQ